MTSPPQLPHHHPPPLAVSPHLPTWWFGLMSIGGLGFGVFARQMPFGKGLLGHPLVVFFALAAAMLLTLRFLYTRPLTDLIPLTSLAMGCVIAVVCFFLGDWFGTSLMALP